MSFTEAPSAKLHWLLVVFRVLLVSFLLTLLAFAACLLLGILGLVISGWLHGVHPDMTLAYRHFAFPVAVATGVIALLAAIVMEGWRTREM
ncbi:MAG TPA: hypothetical protein VHS34_16675 [Terriglobales bacterium]|jgi:hypothetical protein|nr:hypothetical protein [Terriglobales bacterium]